jgi:hypothetical protein
MFTRLYNWRVIESHFFFFGELSFYSAKSEFVNDVTIPMGALWR